MHNIYIYTHIYIYFELDILSRVAYRPPRTERPRANWGHPEGPGVGWTLKHHEFRIWGFGFEFRNWGFGFEFRSWGFGIEFRIWGFGFEFRVWVYRSHLSFEVWV